MNVPRVCSDIRCQGNRGHGVGLLGDVAGDEAEHEISSSRLLQRHALLGQFLLCFLVLGQVHQAHPTQHIGRLGELDVVVTDDLYSITPGVSKIKERTIKWGNTSCLECLAGRAVRI